MGIGHMEHFKECSWRTKLRVQSKKRHTKVCVCGRKKSTSKHPQSPPSPPTPGTKLLTGKWTVVKFLTAMEKGAGGGGEGEGGQIQG